MKTSWMCSWVMESINYPNDRPWNVPSLPFGAAFTSWHMIIYTTHSWTDWATDDEDAFTVFQSELFL